MKIVVQIRGAEGEKVKSTTNIQILGMEADGRPSLAKSM
jgi:hypothetical protein